MTAKEQGLPELPRAVAYVEFVPAKDGAGYDADVNIWANVPGASHPEGTDGLYTAAQMRAYALAALASDTGERGDKPAWWAGARVGLGVAPDTPRTEVAEMLAALDAGRREIPEHVRKLVGRIDCYRSCMSYNESYFGEPPGLLKGVFAELAHAMNPIYPSGKTALYPAKPTFPGVVIANAEHPEGVPADELIAALRAQPAGGGEGDAVLAERTALLNAGGPLANIAFNLAQSPRLTADERDSLDKCRKAWDAACLALVERHAPTQPSYAVVTGMAGPCHVEGCALTQPQPACGRCDNTGDIHTPTGEWRGVCPDCTPPESGGQGEAVAVCEWHQQDQGSDCVSTSCGHEFIINDAGDYEDGKPAFPFCCYCAKPQVFHHWVDEDAEDDDTAALAQGGGNER